MVMKCFLWQALCAGSHYAVRRSLRYDAIPAAAF